MFLKNSFLRKSAAILTSLAIFSSTLPFVAMAEEAPTSGMCGVHTTWSFNADTKTLTIGTSGVSEDGTYQINYNDWDNYETQIENVVIEEGVTHVSYFSGNSYVKSVSLSSTVVSDSFSFEECGALETVTLADGITAIPSRAFLCCNSLKEIVIPDSVLSIGDQAFYECSSLGKVTLPVKLESIGDHAFYNCDSLMELEIPESVTSISTFAIMSYPEGFKIKGKYNSAADKYAMANNIPFEATNELTATTGLKYNLLADGTYEATNYTGDEARVLIPSTFNGKPVTAISARAFDSNESIFEVIVPESVTKIGNRAFNGCRNLKSVKLHDGITEIEDGAFYYCSLSDGFTIPAGVKTLRYRIFGNTNLKEIVIPDTVDVIEAGVFSSCYNLEKVTISEGVMAIGEDAFAWCFNLKSLHIPSTAIIGDTREYYVDSEGYYYDYSSWLSWRYGGIPSTNVKIKDINGNPVQFKAVPENGLPVGTYTRVVYGRLGVNPIRGSGIETLTVAAGNPYVKTVDNVLYDKTGELLIAYPVASASKSFAVPEGVKYIHYYAFNDSDTLETVTLPESLISIYNAAFWNCTALKSITIPKNVILESATSTFGDCTVLENLYIDEEHPYYYDVDGIAFAQDDKELVLEKYSNGNHWVGTSGQKYDSSTTEFESEKYLLGQETVVIETQAELPEDDTSNDSDNDDYVYDEEELPVDEAEEIVLCEDPIELIYYPEGKTAATYTVPAEVDYIRCNFPNVKELIIQDGTYAMYGSALRSNALETITIPASVKYISSDYDNYPSTLTIKGYTNSYAEVFAKTYNINFVSIGEVDPEDTYYYIRTTVEGGSCIVNPSKAEAVTEGGKLTLTFTPDNSSTSATQYEIESVVIDGVDMGYIKSYTFENVTSDHNVVVKLKTISNRIPTGSGSMGNYKPVDKTPVTDEDEKNAILVKDTEGAIKADGTDKVWEEIAEEAGEKKDGETVAIALPAAATEIPANLLESVKGKDVEVEIKLENGVTWCINGLSVRDPKAINLGVTINSNQIPRDALTNVPNGVHNIEVSLEHDGDLGFDATLTFDFDERYNNFYSNLYFYNPDLGDFEFMGASTIHNGKAGHGFSHASDYIIIVDEENLGKKVVEIEEEEDIASDDEEDWIDSETEEETDNDEDEKEISEDDDENPATGTAISCTALICAAAAVVLARKKKADK